MKKKLLFVIPNLGAGGAEKSLVNLLNTLDPDRYSVDVFLFYQTGLFLNQLPEFVNVLPLAEELDVFQKPLLKSVFHYLIRGRLSLALNRVRFTFIQYSTTNKSITEQSSWKYKCKSIEKLHGQYDTAIAFLEKTSIYFIVDKVQAFKKIGFVHTYYSKLDADHQFDAHYFAFLNNIVAVSEECKEDLQINFPQFGDRLKIVQNIISPKFLKKLATEKSEILPENSILSIGRLVQVKGFDLAVEAARILSDKDINFHWFLIGEGEERKNLETLIAKYDLQDRFHLLGLKENPYPFIEKATVFVQPSRYEGKSISVDEAKILAKPIVLTNFTTAKDQIKNGYDGVICGMSANALADSILRYFEDQEFTKFVVTNLKAQEFGTEYEIEHLYQLIDA